MRGGGVGWEGRRIHRKGQSYFKTSNFLCDCSFFLLNYEEYYFTTFISGNVRNTFNFSLFSQIAFFCEIKKNTKFRCYYNSTRKSLFSRNRKHAEFILRTFSNIRTWAIFNLYSIFTWPKNLVFEQVFFSLVCICLCVSVCVLVDYLKKFLTDLNETWQDDE